jgi:transcription-repair coupling factor (superfamily II helicase)
MNISHAASIIFYEIYKKKKNYPIPELEKASLKEENGLIKDMNEIIDKFGRLDKESKNLIKIVILRIYLSTLYISKLNLKKNNITLYFKK